ncbi:HAMP domain-containing protein, partial [Enterococcus faecium]
MKRKVRFFRSVNFKIAITFILILLISIEIIGAYFIRGLERSTINTFIKDMNQTVESLATTISPELNRKDNADDEEVNANIKRFIENSATSDIIEIRVVDEKGIIRGTTDVNEQSAVGKKNDYVDINDFTTKRYVALDNDDKRVNINVQPILSPTGDAVIGALYVKSNIEQKYSEINNTAVIFFTASLIAAFISMIVSVLVARSITQPIGEMREQAIRIARGDYSRKVKVHGQDELGQLADTFNQLAERIEEAQDTMEAERNRLDSVLSHMTDGVIATDRRGKVITINDMAVSLLDIKNEEAIGQSILTLLDIEEEYTLRK